MQPRISVCICTRNRLEDLGRCLDSIRRSELPADEIVAAPHLSE